ncbi:MAG: nitrogen fixation protein NifQ [Nitrospirae bacterium]|nr:nitrogen fixation protein NifQ [Nitrospirota bacterium]MBI5695488.1 nitrogen fixation protein NifQ [Nitrospirota bacterium]
METQGIINVPEARREEFEDLRGLLMDNLSVPPGEGEAVAELVAASCLGGNHLWQDLKLPDRAALSALMKAYFRPLSDANVHDMKWKKFFYKKICEREGFMLCKSPSCGDCVDYHKCFGPEV